MLFYVLFSHKTVGFGFRKVTNFTKRKGRLNFISFGLILRRITAVDLGGLKNEEYQENNMPVAFARHDFINERTRFCI